MTGPAEPILIVGGGIGGLTCAIALANRGIRSIVLERRQSFSEAGAGIQIGPNGTRVLQDLGVLAVLEPLASKPESLVARSAASGRILAELPLGRAMLERFGAPYWVLHRADLQRVLLDAAFSSDRIEIRTGFRVESIVDNSNGVIVTSSDGEAIHGAAAIGADGLWSTVRDLIAPPRPLAFMRRTATRTTIAAKTLPAWLQANQIGIWLSPSGHAVHYPIRGGEEVAVVLVASDDQDEPGWDNIADVADVSARLASFSPQLSEPLLAAGGWRKWGLYRPDDNQVWSHERVTLLGDAAHPVMPYLAQGGVLAIEDAALLAREVVRASDIATAFKCYESLRKPRARAVQAAAERNGRIYHMAWPMSLARDTSMRVLGGARLLQTYDWLYGWRLD